MVQAFKVAYSSCRYALSLHTCSDYLSTLGQYIIHTSALAGVLARVVRLKVSTDYQLWW